MSNAVPPDTETQEPSRPTPGPERRGLARAVGVWWVQRLLQAARRRRADVPPRDEDDELHAPAPAGR